MVSSSASVVIKMSVFELLRMASTNNLEKVDVCVYYGYNSVSGNQFGISTQETKQRH